MAFPSRVSRSAGVALIRTGLIAVAGLLFASGLAAQAAAPTAPAAMDTLLERLVGRWRMKGTVRGAPALYTLDVTRVLQRRFVELHMVDVHRPPGYEARVFIGVDSANARYIAHWLDRFGAAYSIPHATGEMGGDTLRLDFPYPDGAFHDTFVYDRRSDSWYFLLEAADTAGGWTRFAEYQVRRR
jgi:hypothetical protein